MNISSVLPQIETDCQLNFYQVDIQHSKNLQDLYLDKTDLKNSSLIFLIHFLFSLHHLHVIVCFIISIFIIICQSDEA